MKTITIADAKASAEQRIADIDTELATLGQERGKLSLDFTLGISGAEEKLRKLGDKVRTLHEQRDEATLAIAEAERREDEQEQRDREAQRTRLLRQRDKLLGERAARYDDVVATVETLEDLIGQCLAADARIAPITSALGEPPVPMSRQSKAKLVNFTTWRLAEAGLRPDIVPPHPTLRVRPNEIP
jgi:SMC interacting uncharacterized protein involved in chromosome segregation